MTTIKNIQKNLKQRKYEVAKLYRRYARIKFETFKLCVDMVDQIEMGQLTTKTAKIILGMRLKELADKCGYEEDSVIIEGQKRGNPRVAKRKMNSIR